MWVVVASSTILADSPYNTGRGLCIEKHLLRRSSLGWMGSIVCLEFCDCTVYFFIAPAPEAYVEDCYKGSRQSRALVDVDFLPMADIVTPNLKEASALLGGVQLETVDDMRSAAKSIHDMGPRNVFVKGGDLAASLDAVDIFFDGENFYELHSPCITTRNTHGTDCTLASLIAAELAKGSRMLSAVKVSKRYVETALDYSKDIAIGNGLHGMNRNWGHSITDAVKAAIEGGATIVQLREKDAETQDFLEAAKACVCRSHGISLLINDRIDVALACDADGVHVGQSDMPASVARALLGPEKIIGMSCKRPEQAHRALVDGADYIGCGGVYPTATKENNISIGLEALKAVFVF
ncbi:thiamin biosynthesis protein [Actinidia rufa]|uniref:thiamine phosphate synthase n=1 Tax=Actinidia rufa TaxID=165716 RepID=A0A7J0ES98_9ERIC|nr:thiamin biosynthesis protein [Actinidia rufa]